MPSRVVGRHKRCAQGDSESDYRRTFDHYETAYAEFEGGAA